MRICSETHSIFWHDKEVAQMFSQNYCWRSSQLHHVVTIRDVSRFAAFCSTVQYPVFIRPIVDSLPDFIKSFPSSFLPQHIPLLAVAALPRWEKLSKTLHWATKGSNATTTKRLAFPDKEGPMLDDSSLLPAQAPNQIEQPA